ncbi:MAG: tol-pal system protein YbgF [Gammaproteobacteria bacterium]|jgi:tol-pal system protein YbgF
MMFFRMTLLAAALTAASPASATLWGRVEKLENRMEVVTELTQRVDALQQENNALRGQIEELHFELEQLKTQQRELYLDIERRLGGPSAAGQAKEAPVSMKKEAAAQETEKMPDSVPPAPSPVAPAAPPPSGEREEYRHAYDLLMTQRKIPEAIDAFTAFLASHPNGRYADNAQFWLGEAYYARNDLDGAMSEFQALVDGYGDSPKVPDAVYKVGHIHKIKGENDKARMVFEGLIQHYPDSSAAKLAQQRLSSL